MSERELFRRAYYELLDYADTEFKDRCAEWGLNILNLVKKSGRLLGTPDTNDKELVFMHAVSTAFIVGKFGGFAFGDYFSNESEINLEKLLLKPNDIYFYYWLANLKPVYGQDFYHEFIKANNWLKKYLPNFNGKEIREIKIKSYKLLELKKSFLEFIFKGSLGDWLEDFWRKIQIKRVWADPKNKRMGASVVASHSMLKLHAYDKRTEYQQSFEQQFNRLTKK